MNGTERCPPIRGVAQEHTAAHCCRILPDHHNAPSRVYSHPRMIRDRGRCLIKAYGRREGLPISRNGKEQARLLLSAFCVPGDIETTGAIHAHPAAAMWT